MKAFKQMSGFAVLLGLGVSIGLPAQQETKHVFELKDGDRVVFYGDSITAQHLYTRFIEDMVVSRYPERRIRFYNAGVSGDTVRGGSDGDAETRVPRDVAPFKPTVLTVSLGANDGRYTTEPEKAKENLAAYAEGYRALLTLLQQNAAPGAKITLTSPIAYDEISQTSPIPGYNGVMLQYGAFVRSLAAEQHLEVASYNEAMTAALANAAMTDSTLAQELVPDHVHPSYWGHLVLATEMAKTWGIDPLVDSVALDFKQGAVISAKKTSVHELKKTAEGLTWSELDTCLPLPLEIRDPLMKLLLPISEIASIDQEILQVAGLPADAYKLMIDDKTVAIFSKEQLQNGVNLALYDTPMESQARSIDWDGAERRTKMSAARHTLLVQKPAEYVAAVKAVEAVDEQLIRGEYEHAQPVQHRFELRAATSDR